MGFPKETSFLKRKYITLRDKSRIVFALKQIREEYLAIFFYFKWHKFRFLFVSIIIFIMGYFTYIYFEVINLQWLISALIQALASLIGLLVTAGVFSLSVTRGAREKETKYNAELKKILHKYKGNLTVAKSDLEGKIEKVFREDLLRDLFDVTLVIYIFYPSDTSIDILLKHLNRHQWPSNRDFYREAASGFNPYFILQKLQGINYQGMPGLRDEIEGFMVENDASFYVDKHVFKSFTDRRMLRVLVALITSILLLVFSLLIINSHLGGHISFIETTKLIIATSIAISVASLMLLLRFILILFGLHLDSTYDECPPG